MPTPPEEDNPSEKPDDDNWDRQMKADAEAGRLNALMTEALDDLRDGRCSNL
jgi:hypothetical protein